MNRQNILYTLLTLTCAFVSPAVAGDMNSGEKSELVKDLESVFYDFGFAKIEDKEFKTQNYGAKADGKTINTESIQAAIDAAHKAGGGVVTFPPGTYRTGALFVKSNVELRLDEGVILQAIQDDSHYPRMPTRIGGFEMVWPAALINVYEQKNVRVTGKGIIDGNGEYWWKKYWGEDGKGGMRAEYGKGLRGFVDYDCERVRAVVVWKSEDVLLKNFTIQRSGFWTVSMTYCDRVHVDGVIVRNNIGGHGPSSDGINTDSSSNVLVENCDIDCNDDNLCIKSGRDADGLRVNRPAENVVYRNCITRAGHALLSFGSDTSGGMRNCEVYGIKGIGTRIGIRFKSAKIRGGVIEDVYFHDIEMEGADYPIKINLNWHPGFSYPSIPKNIPESEIPERWKLMTQRVSPPEKGIPEVRNIRISNLRATGAKMALSANGYAEKPINNVVLENVSITARTAGSLENCRDWTMTNVTINAKDKLVLKNCANVELSDDDAAEVRKETLTIGLIGDSTVASTYGWGPAFASRFRSGVAVLHYAKNGATLDSLSKKLDELIKQKPNYILIQFGHNDMKRYATETYRQKLGDYVERVRRGGSKAIVLSSVTRRNFDEHGKIAPRIVNGRTLRDYSTAAQAVAREMEVPFIDLNSISIEHHNRIGPEASVAYNCVPNNSRKKSEIDTTHFSKQGATIIADLIINELKTVVPELVPYLK